MSNRTEDGDRCPRRKACAYCGYDHDDDFEAEMAALWHESHDASIGKHFDPSTLKEVR